MEVVKIIILITTFVLGAMFGSFACCQAWRLRLKERGEKSPGRWSVCLSCHHRLRPLENIPIFSWLRQRGRCRHCGARIGKAEFFSELGLGLVFLALALYLFPHFLQALDLNSSLNFSQSSIIQPTTNLVMLILMTLVLIISIIVMWILLIYDAKWQRLPIFLLTILNACAIIYIILRFVGLILNSATSGQALPLLLSTLGAVVILAGIYLMLYLVSHGKLVGSGDWLIALPLALFLGNWWLALILLFVSNFLGSLYGFGLLALQNIKLKTRRSRSAKSDRKAATHKSARSASAQPHSAQSASVQPTSTPHLRARSLRIPFGPFLILSFILVYCAQDWLISLMP